MTLRLKLIVSTVALVIVGLVATGVITVALTRAEMIDRVDATLAEAIRRPRHRRPLKSTTPGAQIHKLQPTREPKVRAS